MKKSIKKGTKKNTNNEIDIRTYFEMNGALTRTNRALLSNLEVSKISVVEFCQHFNIQGENIIQGILDTLNTMPYEVSRWASHKVGSDRFYAYNGKSIYDGYTCTLGASHSNFAG